MNLDLDGKNALVCGSTQGIGWAAACELAQMGATVVLLARNARKLADQVSELPRPNDQLHDCITHDFDESNKLTKRLNDWQIRSQFKPIHILINNTGGPPAGPITEATSEAFLQAFQNHLISNQLLVQHFLDDMKQAEYGRIVNVISTSVRVPIAGLGVSNTTRGAVASWAKTLANEIGRFGITVNNVLPGFTQTARLDAIIANRAKKSGKSEREVVETMKASVPAGRFGQAEEVGAMIAFLCSPVAGYVSGQSIAVDGGRTPAL